MHGSSARCGSQRPAKEDRLEALRDVDSSSYVWYSDKRRIGGFKSEVQRRARRPVPAVSDGDPVGPVWIRRVSAIGLRIPSVRRTARVEPRPPIGGHGGGSRWTSGYGQLATRWPRGSHGLSRCVATVYVENGQGGGQGGMADTIIGPKDLVIWRFGDLQIGDEGLGPRTRGR